MCLQRRRCNPPFLFLLQEDHYALLVKAWETKVFPTIRRRFRNEAERKSGLDQIKGALQLGNPGFHPGKLRSQKAFKY